MVKLRSDSKKKTKYGLRLDIIENAQKSIMVFPMKIPKNLEKLSNE